MSAARIQGATPGNVDQFFSIVNIKFSPNWIINVDESGIIIVQLQIGNVDGQNGKR
jgi:hypothetical protein